MTSFVLNPFRLDALFRTYRLCPKREQQEAGGCNCNALDGFSARFFRGVPREGGGSGLTPTEINSIKRLSSAQGRSFLRTLAGVKELSEADAARANAAELFSLLTEDGVSAFIGYVVDGLGSRFLTEEEAEELRSACRNRSPEALYLSFRHAYAHLSHVTGVAAVSQYELAQTFPLGAEARIRICRELAPHNANACVEYGDWLAGPMGDYGQAFRTYCLHPKSALCLWHAANLLRKAAGTGRPFLSGFHRNAAWNQVEKTVRDAEREYAPETAEQLRSAKARNGSEELSAAFRILLFLSSGHDPFCKAFTSLAQMLSSGEMALPQGNGETARHYYDLAIAEGDVTPLLNISNHLASRYANQMIRPLAGGTDAPALTAGELAVMKRFDSLAMDAGFRSCRFSELRIRLCERLAAGGAPDYPSLLAELDAMEEMDLRAERGLSPVFISRSDFWALKGEASPDPEEKARCLEKALAIEEAQGYDHIPQLAYYLCRIYAGLAADGKDPDGSRARRAGKLLDASWSVLSQDERYASGIRELFLELNR